MGYWEPIDWSVSQSRVPDDVGRRRLGCGSPRYSSTRPTRRIATSRPPSASSARPPPTAPSSSCCPRSGRCSARATRCAPAPSRSTARPRGRPRLGARARHPPGRRQHRRAGRGRGAAPNTSVLIDPDGEIVAVYRKIHMFDVDVGGVAYRESAHEQPGDEIVSAAARRARARVDRLLRPSLPRALPDPRRARRPVITVPSAFTRRPGATTGRCCCGRGRSRTRSS